MVHKNTYPDRFRWHWDPSSDVFRCLGDENSESEPTAFDRYRASLEDVRGIMARDVILARAAQDNGLDLEEFVRLCRLADPEGAD